MALEEGNMNDYVLVEKGDVVDFNSEGILPQPEKTLNRILGWLQPTDYLGSSSEYTRHKASWTPETGAWIQNTTQYSEWHRNDSGSNILWIKGLPGSGKSVLAASLIQKYVQEQGFPVLFFFFRNIIARNRLPKHLVQDFLAQLLRSSPVLQARLNEYLKEGRNLDDVTFESLWEDLAVGIRATRGVRCVVDAIDEMPEGASQLLEWIAALSSDDASNTKFILLSRPSVDIDIQLRQLSVQRLSLGGSGVEEDVAKFLQHRFQNITAPHISEAVKINARGSIQSRAEGLFIHARLMTESVINVMMNDPENTSSIEDTVQALPLDLEEMYDRSLLDRSESIAGVTQELQVLIFECLTHANRAIRLVELAYMVIHMLPKEYKSKPREFVRLACGPLLDVLEDGTVQIIHHSLTEFLENRHTAERSKNNPRKRKFPVISDRSAHCSLATISLDYLTSGILDKWMESDHVKSVDRQRTDIRWNGELYRSLPLLDYALSNWHKHATKPRVEAPVFFLSFERFFEGDACEAWLSLDPVPMLNNWNRSMRAFTKSDKFFIVSYLGLCGYVKYLCDERNYDINSVDNNGRSALSYASMQGHLDLVETLIDRKTSLEDPDKNGMRPLHYASKHDRGLVVTALLNANVEPEAIKTRNDQTPYLVPPSTGLTAMDFACMYGSLDAVIALAPKVPTASRERGICLAAQSAKGVVVEHLLENGLASSESTSDLGQAALYLASQSMDSRAVRALLKHGADANKCTQEASKNVSNAWATRYSRGKRKNSNSTPLHAFAEYSHAYENKSRAEAQEVLHALLGAGADLEALDADGRTPLLRAPPAGTITGRLSYSTAELLLENGANINVVDKEGHSTLHKLMRYGSNNDNTTIEPVIYMIDQGADPNLQNKTNGSSPFLYACDHMGGKGLEAMLKSGASATMPNFDGDTPLHIICAKTASNTNNPQDTKAFWYGRIRLMIDYGADMNARNNKGQTPLHLVQARTERQNFGPSRDSLNLLETLLEAGADIEARDYTGRTPLLEHVVAKDKDTVADLLRLGADIHAVDLQGKSSLHLATRRRLFGGIALINLLLEHGADGSARDFEGNTVLHEISSIRHPYDHTFSVGREVEVKQARLIFDLSLISPDVKNNHGLTPLHVLADATFPLDSDREDFGDMPDVLDSFLEYFKPKNVDDRSHRHLTPLHIAATSSEHHVVRLLRYGANPLLLADQSRTALHLACRARQPNIVGLFADIFKDSAPQMVDHQDSFGRTALHDACRSGKVESVQLLLEAGANPTIQDKQGRTPLFACAEIQEEGAVWDALRLKSKATRLEVFDRSRPILGPDNDRHRSYDDLEIPKGVTEHDVYHIPDMIEILFKYGADGTVVDRHDETAYDYAQRMQSSEVCRALLSQKPGESKNLEMPYISLAQTLEIRFQRFQQLEDEFPNPENLTSDGVPPILVEILKTGCSVLITDLLNKMKPALKQSANLMKAVKSLLARRGYSRGLDTVISAEQYHVAEEKQPLPKPSSPDSETEGVDEINDDSPLNPDQTIEDQASLFIEACERKTYNMKTLRLLIRKYGINCAYKPAGGNKYEASKTAMHVLASGKYWWYSKALKYLLEQGVPVDCLDKEGSSPLHIACAPGELFQLSGFLFAEACVNVLLEYGANPDLVNKHGFSCLAKAARRKDPNLAKQLLKNGADVTRGPYHLLCAAIQSENVDMLKELLHHGVNANAKNTEVSGSGVGNDPKLWEYPLEFAACCTPWNRDSSISNAMVKLLLDNKADYTVPVRDRVPTGNGAPLRDGVPLLHLIFSGDDRCFKESFFGRDDIDFEHRDAQGRTVLMSVLSQHQDRLRGIKELPTVGESLPGRIMKQNVNCSVVDNQGQNLLHSFLLGNCSSSSAILEYMLSIGEIKALINQPDNTGLTPLQAALGGQSPANFKEKNVQLLIDAGADMTPPDPSGNEILHLLAARMPISDLCRKLFKNRLWLGDDLEARNDSGKTPLLLYLSAAQSLCVRDGKTYDAVLETLKTLFHAADFHVKDNEGSTVLHILAKRIDYYSGRPASTHTHYGRPDPNDLFKLMMSEHKLDPHLEDYNHRTSLDVAATFRNEGILDLFREKSRQKCKNTEEE